MKFIQEITAKEGKEKAPYTEHVIPEDAYKLVTEYITDARMEEAVFAELKQDRDAKIKVITEEVLEHCGSGRRNHLQIRKNDC